MHRIQTNERRGFVVSIEMILVIAVALIALVVAATAIRDSVVSELSDVAGSVGDANQSFSFNGVVSNDASSAGSGYTDNTDSADTPDDTSGVADNGISFAVSPTEEGNSTGGGGGGTGGGGGGLLSAVGTFSFDTFAGGPATGTIGDGTINTGFTVTGSDPGIVVGTAGNEIVFSEQPSDAGSITTTFDDPLTEVEVFFSSVNNDGDPHLIGNFTVTLSDGTILNNASFNVVPDAISPSTSLGPFFTTSDKDVDLISTTTSGGNQFVTDPVNDGDGFGNRQAAGRLRFTDSAITGAPAGVGITSITFERSGGQVDFTSRYSVSGRVNQ